MDGLDTQLDNRQRERLAVGLVRFDHEPIDVLRQSGERVFRLRLGQSIPDPPDHLVDEREQQVLLRVEMVVQQRPALVELVGDILHREVGVPVFAQRAIGRAHDRLVGVTGVLGWGPGPSVTLRRPVPGVAFRAHVSSVGWHPVKGSENPD